MLHEVSHNNLLMYAAAIPPLDADNEKQTDSRTNLDDLDWGGKMDMSNPDNFKDQDDQRQRV